VARQPTAEQSQFIEGVASGLSYAESYRQTYNAENMSTETIPVKASHLANRDDIRVIIEQKKKELAAKGIWSRELALMMLREIATEATEDPSPNKAQIRSVAIRAIEQANKMCGYNEPDKVEHSGAVTIELAGELAEWAK
jgi:hypothetical protein